MLCTGPDIALQLGFFFVPHLIWFDQVVLARRKVD